MICSKCLVTCSRRLELYCSHRKHVFQTSTITFQWRNKCPIVSSSSKYREHTSIPLFKAIFHLLRLSTVGNLLRSKCPGRKDTFGGTSRCQIFSSKGFSLQGKLISIRAEYSKLVEKVPLDSSFHVQ